MKRFGIISVIAWNHCCMCMAENNKKEEIK
jgi:hypothetical protein